MRSVIIWRRRIPVILIANILQHLASATQESAPTSIRARIRSTHFEFIRTCASQIYPGMGRSVVDLKIPIHETVTNPMPMALSQDLKASLGCPFSKLSALKGLISFNIRTLGLDSSCLTFLPGSADIKAKQRAEALRSKAECGPARKAMT